MLFSYQNILAENQLIFFKSSNASATVSQTGRTRSSCVILINEYTFSDGAANLICPLLVLRILFATRIALKPELSQLLTSLKSRINFLAFSTFKRRVNSPLRSPDMLVSSRSSFNLKTVISSSYFISKFI